MALVFVVAREALADKLVEKLSRGRETYDRVA
jgi:hypothetical protein